MKLNWNSLQFFFFDNDVSADAVGVSYQFHLFLANPHAEYIRHLLRCPVELASSCSSSANLSMLLAKRKFIIFLFSMLSDPWCPSSASVLILSGYTLTIVSEGKHPCLTSTIVLNHPTMVQKRKTVADWLACYEGVLWPWSGWQWCCTSWRSLKRFVPQPVKSFLESTKMWQGSCLVWVLSRIVPLCWKSVWLYSDLLYILLVLQQWFSCLRLYSLQQHHFLWYLAWLNNQTDGAIVLSKL